MGAVKSSSAVGGAVVQAGTVIASADCKRRPMSEIGRNGNKSRSNSFEMHRVRLHSRLSMMGLEEIPIKADGNCFFAALSDSLKHGYKIDHIPTELRSKCVEELLSNRERYACYSVSGELSDDHARKFQANGFYDAELGDLIPLSAANALKVCISIVSSIEGLNDCITFYPATTADEDARTVKEYPCVMLAYTQFRKGHYNSTRRKKDKRSIMVSMSEREVHEESSTLISKGLSKGISIHPESVPAHSDRIPVKSKRAVTFRVSPILNLICAAKNVF